MMCKKNGCLKLMKDANPEIVVVHCVHRTRLKMVFVIVDIKDIQIVHIF